MPEKIPALRVKDTTFDKIWLHYKDPDTLELSEKQQQVNERLVAAWTSLVGGNTPTFVRNMLIMTYGIKQAQAYRYIRKAQELFGKVLNANVAGQKAMLFEMAVQNHKEAKERGDHKSATFYFREMRELVGEELDINFNPEKLEDKPDRFVIPKEVQDAIVNHLTDGVIDFNKLTIEDIPHEEVNDDQAEEEI